jgi:TolA-binding protein
VVDDIDFLDHRLAHERDPVIRARLIREIRRLERIADEYRVDVLEAERQIALAQSEIDGLRRRGVQMRSSMSDQLDRAERDVRNIEKREKRLDADEKKLAKPILDTRPLLPLKRKMESLGTYSPFPLEEEKRRLLDSL